MDFVMRKLTLLPPTGRDWTYKFETGQALGNVPESERPSGVPRVANISNEDYGVSTDPGKEEAGRLFVSSI